MQLSSLSISKENCAGFLLFLKKFKIDDNGFFIIFIITLIYKIVYAKIKVGLINPTLLYFLCFAKLYFKAKVMSASTQTLPSTLPVP